MVDDLRRLAQRYVRSRSFVLDVASLLPLDLVQLRVGVHPLLRAPRFIKTYRLYRYEIVACLLCNYRRSRVQTVHAAKLL